MIANGFSNRFTGWGAEDDDFRERVVKFAKLKYTRPYEQYAKYKMVKHKSEKETSSYKRNIALYHSRAYMRADRDGLTVRMSPQKYIYFPNFF